MCIRDRIYTILTLITFGLYSKLIHWIKNKLVFIVIEFSKLYETNNLALQIISILGLPFAALGSIIVSIIGYHGNFPRRARDIVMFESFPYANTFNDYANKQIDLVHMKPNVFKAIIALIESPDEVRQNILLYRASYLFGTEDLLKRNK